MLDATTGAFAHGLHVAAFIAIGRLVATCALVAVVLRVLPAAGEVPAQLAGDAPAAAST